VRLILTLSNRVDQKIKQSSTLYITAIWAAFVCLGSSCGTLLSDTLFCFADLCCHLRQLKSPFTLITDCRVRCWHQSQLSVILKEKKVSGTPDKHGTKWK